MAGNGQGADESKPVGTPERTDAFTTPPQNRCGREQSATMLAELSQQMPLLVGQPLPAPNLVKVDWRPDQCFSNSRDDPDRMQQPWNAPSFVFDSDPILRSKQVTVEELKVPSAGGFARIIRGLLTEQECLSLVNSINGKGFTPVLVNVGNDEQQFLPDVRDGYRSIVDTPELTRWLLEAMRPYLPAELEGSQLVDLNERCRTLCYTPGQYFEAHFDGRYTRPMSHANGGDFSRITVQLYLNDVPESHGGATTFLFHKRDDVQCQPTAGSALVFTQDLYHEGTLLKQGLKYTIRTEAMYRSCKKKPENEGYLPITQRT